MPRAVSVRSRCLCARHLSCLESWRRALLVPVHRVHKRPASSCAAAACRGVLRSAAATRAARCGAVARRGAAKLSFFHNRWLLGAQRRAMRLRVAVRSLTRRGRCPDVMTNAASDLAKASLAGFHAGSCRAADKFVAPQDSGAMLLDALNLGRSALDQPAGVKQAARGVHIGVPATAPRQNPPEVVPPPPTPPIAVPLRAAISPVAADGEASGANLAMRCAAVAHALLPALARRLLCA